MATVLFIALLAIMLMLVMAESRALIQLHREVKLVGAASNQTSERRSHKRGRQRNF